MPFGTHIVGKLGKCRLQDQGANRNKSWLVVVIFWSVALGAGGGGFWGLYRSLNTLMAMMVLVPFTHVGEEWIGVSRFFQKRAGVTLPAINGVNYSTRYANGDNGFFFVLQRSRKLIIILSNNGRNRRFQQVLVNRCGKAPTFLLYIKHTWEAPVLLGVWAVCRYGTNLKLIG